MPGPERTIEAALVRGLKARGILALKFVCPGETGVPDRLVLLADGRSFFVEVKAPGCKPTPKQREWHDRLRAMGHPVHVVDGINAVECMLYDLDGTRCMR